MCFYLQTLVFGEAQGPARGLCWQIPLRCCEVPGVLLVYRREGFLSSMYVVEAGGRRGLSVSLCTTRMKTYLSRCSPFAQWPMGVSGLGLAVPARLGLPACTPASQPCWALHQDWKVLTDFSVVLKIVFSVRCVRVCVSGCGKLGKIVFLPM